MSVCQAPIDRENSNAADDPLSSSESDDDGVEASSPLYQNADAPSQATIESQDSHAGRVNASPEPPSPIVAMAAAAQHRAQRIFVEARTAMMPAGAMAHNGTADGGATMMREGMGRQTSVALSLSGSISAGGGDASRFGSSPSSAPPPPTHPSSVTLAPSSLPPPPTPTFSQHPSHSAATTAGWSDDYCYKQQV